MQSFFEFSHSTATEFVQSVEFVISLFSRWLSSRAAMAAAADRSTWKQLSFLVLSFASGSLVSLGSSLLCSGMALTPYTDCRSFTSCQGKARLDRPVWPCYSSSGEVRVVHSWGGFYGVSSCMWRDHHFLRMTHFWGTFKDRYGKAHHSDGITAATPNKLKTNLKLVLGCVFVI